MIVVEVKQLEENPEEKKHLKQYIREGSTDTILGEPGKRLRNVIKKAMPQLKETSRNLVPTMLVVYDNTILTLGALHRYEIITGMYGLEEVVIGVPQDLEREPYLADHKFGSKQKVSPSHNTTLSAVAVMEKIKDISIRLDIIHNDYSINPLDPEWVRHDGCHHWKREESKRTNAWRNWDEL